MTYTTFKYGLLYIHVPKMCNLWTSVSVENHQQEFQVTLQLYRLQDISSMNCNFDELYPCKSLNFFCTIEFQQYTVGRQMLSFAADGVDRMSFNEEMTLFFPPEVGAAAKTIFAETIMMQKKKKEKCISRAGSSRRENVDVCQHISVLTRCHLSQSKLTYDLFLKAFISSFQLPSTARSYFWCRLSVQ